MATLNIEGRRVTVDDAFLKLPPEQQQKAVEEISASFAPPDKYRQAAEQEFADLKAKGVPVEAGYSRRIAQGATFGAADEILAGLQTPLEMVKRGELDPREAYHYAKARENVILEDAHRRQGALGTAAELAGGVGSGVGLASNGVTLTRAGMGLPARIATGAVEGAGYGGISGFLGGGDSFEDRFSAAGRGAAGGAALGGALPAAGAVLSPVVAPVVSSIRARINPQGVADSQFARALSESGLTPQEIEMAVRRAAAEGQGEFTVADALGNAGQRMLSNVTRAPGGGRQTAIDFLDTRQAGQGRRVGAFLAEDLQAPQTAAQAERALIAQRRAEANTNYGDARSAANAVDVTPAIEAADSVLAPGATRLINPGSNIADNSIESTLRRARSYLSDGRSQVSDFSSALAAKREIDHLIETGSPSQQRALIPVRDALDDSLARASQPYANARDTFRRQSQSIEAIPEGSAAATRGRSEDTVARYGAMSPEQQGGFRIGYADRLIEAAQGAAPGVNKARGLAADATQAELRAMAGPNADRAARRVERENTMFETRRQATGGSQTADNLADQEAMRVDPSVMGALLSGNVLSAGANALRNTVTNLSGYTPAVRERLAELLLQRGTSPSVADVARRVAAGNERKGDWARVLKGLTHSGGGIAAATLSGGR